MLDTSTYFAFPIHLFCSLFHPFCFPKIPFLDTVILHTVANGLDPFPRTINFNDRYKLEIAGIQILMNLMRKVVLQHNREFQVRSSKDDCC